MFLNFPKRFDLLESHSNKIAIIGNKIPLLTWANFIISIGLKPIDENKTPVIKIIIHTALNLGDFKSDFPPKQFVNT